MKDIFLTILIATTMFNLFGQSDEAKTAEEFKKNSSQIYPVIKVVFTENKEADFTLAGEDEPISKQIAGDLACFYGIDKGTHFELLQQRHLPDGVGVKELDDYARENLLTFINDKTKIHQTRFGGLGFSCGGEYEAALLVIPEVWEMLEEQLGKSIVFAVPSKDMIVFVNADNQEAIKGLKDMVKEIHKDGDRLLSKQLFTYENGKINLR